MLVLLHILAGSAFIASAATSLLWRRVSILKVSQGCGVLTLASGSALLFMQPGSITAACVRGLVLTAGFYALQKINQAIKAYA